MSASGWLCASWRKSLSVGLRPQAVSQSIAFSSPSHQWEIRTSFTFTFFQNVNSFWYIITVPWWSKDLPVENLQFVWLQVAGVQLLNPPVQFRRELWPRRTLLWGSVQAIASTDLWPHLFGIACNGRPRKQFRCLCLSKEACGAPPLPVALVSCKTAMHQPHSHFASTWTWCVSWECRRNGKTFQK